MSIFLIAIIYLCFVSLGLPDSLLGTAWPSIYVEIDVPVSYMSYILITITSFTIISSLFSHVLSKKLGPGLLTAISISLTAIGLIGFSFCKFYWMFFIMAIPYGLGAGGVDSVLNNYVALNLKSYHMSWLHCMWGVGAFISPLIMSFSLNQKNWRMGYFIVFVIQLSVCIVVFASLPIWKKVEKSIGNINRENKENIEKNKEEKKSEIGIIGVFKLKGALLIFIAFFCYCALEQTAFQWSTSYFVLVNKIDKQLAASLASFCYLGITLGRLLNGFLSMKFKDKTLIFSGCCLVFVGVVMLIFSTNNIYLSVTSFALIGIGCAPIYPSIVHNTPNLFGKDNSQVVIGVQMAFAYVSNIITPPLFSLIIDNIGIKLLPIYLIVFLLLTFLFYFIALKIKEKETVKKVKI